MAQSGVLICSAAAARVRVVFVLLLFVTASLSLAHAVGPAEFDWQLRRRLGQETNQWRDTNTDERSRRTVAMFFGHVDHATPMCRLNTRRPVTEAVPRTFRNRHPRALGPSFGAAVCVGIEPPPTRNAPEKPSKIRPVVEYLSVYIYILYSELVSSPAEQNWCLQGRGGREFSTTNYNRWRRAWKRIQIYFYNKNTNLFS